MSGYLLDTNIISELNKLHANPNVLSFIGSQNLDDLYLSDVTVAEIRYGISKVDDALKRASLDTFLIRMREQFDARILPLSENVIYRWRLLVDFGSKSGHTFAQPDLFIAATAMEHALTVVTRDTANFEKANVPLLNPWKFSS